MMPGYVENFSMLGIVQLETEAFLKFFLNFTVLVIIKIEIFYYFFTAAQAFIITAMLHQSRPANTALLR
jgi:hypothetical protein